MLSSLRHQPLGLLRSARPRPHLSRLPHAIFTPPVHALAPLPSLLPLPPSHGVVNHRYLSSSTASPHWSHQQGHVFTTGVRRPVIPQLVAQHETTLTTLRSFHATARRDALPVLPIGVLAIFKGTTVLALVTAISRVLLSFFPIGILGTFKMSRGIAWLSSDKHIPDASEDAVEFYKMWCENERGVRLTRNEALALVGAPEIKVNTSPGLVGPDGRTAYSMPMPKSWQHKSFVPERPDEEDPEHEHERWAKKMAAAIRSRFFYLPPLPPVSVRYYKELSPEEQHQVDGLRIYWCSLWMFKDHHKWLRLLVAGVVFVPLLLLVGVWASALERVPFTGRWRVILLSPEEEDIISDSLEGDNWYKAVMSLLTTPEKPAPPLLNLNDWRWVWVTATLRHLETSTLRTLERAQLGQHRPPDAPDLYPPAPKHPLQPRPRAWARLYASLPGNEMMSGSEHLAVGPPYNVLILDSPDKNAFSYGFGGNGAGGLVIFTGLLDDILAQGAEDAAPPPPPTPSRGIFGSLFSSPAPPAPVRPQPTEEQSLHLAMVLSHEMGHLLLSHHLETLSHQQVLWPFVLGFGIDLVRAAIWPITFILGPTINDALASFSRAGAEEMTKRYCPAGFEKEHEYEADLSALRLLAVAGYDPRAAVDRFASSIAGLDEIREAEEGWWGLFKSWTLGNVHPAPEERVRAMYKELERWLEESQRERELAEKTAKQ